MIFHPNQKALKFELNFGLYLQFSQWSKKSVLAFSLCFCSSLKWSKPFLNHSWDWESFTELRENLILRQYFWTVFQVWWGISHSLWLQLCTCSSPSYVWRTHRQLRFQVRFRFGRKIPIFLWCVEQKDDWAVETGYWKRRFWISRVQFMPKLWEWSSFFKVPSR